MPDPLPAEVPYSSDYEECVHKYADKIYTLSFLLLKQSAAAEQVTVRVFAELCKPYHKRPLSPPTFVVEAYRCSIRQCREWNEGIERSAGSKRSVDHSRLSAAATSWEEQTLKVLRYGLNLPLPEISSILQKNIPVLKAELRQVREQCTASGGLLPVIKLSAI